MAEGTGKLNADNKLGKIPADLALKLGLREQFKEHN